MAHLSHLRRGQRLLSLSGIATSEAEHKTKPAVDVVHQVAGKLPDGIEAVSSSMFRVITAETFAVESREALSRWLIGRRCPASQRCWCST